MTKKITILLFVLYVILFGQPKPFDPDFYKDTLKVKKSEEFKKLEEYREKYNKIGFPSVDNCTKEIYPYYYNDLFYHKMIDLDRLSEYNKLGLFKDNSLRTIYEDIRNRILKPVIVVAEAKYTSWNGDTYPEPYTIFEVKKILTGKEYYKDFPKEITCYCQMDYHGYPGPGYFKYILFIDTYTNDKIDLTHIREKDAIKQKDTYFNVEWDILFNDLTLKIISETLNVVKELQAHGKTKE